MVISAPFMDQSEEVNFSHLNIGALTVDVCPVNTILQDDRRFW